MRVTYVLIEYDGDTPTQAWKRIDEEIWQLTDDASRTSAGPSVTTAELLETLRGAIEQ